MKTTITTTLFLAGAALASAGDMPVARGPFKPNMESLKQYECPDWFRDAKFGIWSHWGPQAVPMVGDWQKAAKQHGLKFGVSEHLGASFTWFQTSHGADKDGPKKGVPYDGADPRWQDLYHPPAEPGDNKWYSNNPQWQRQWYERIRELVDNYKPDFLYTDGKVPFENEVGLSLIAHLYNSIPQVVYNCKQQQAEGRWVEDLERGVMPGIHPHPWQTDTSIGDWFYNKNWEFRPASWTIHMLCDIVSKNGNLLLNIVQRPDGSLDPEVEQQLEDLAQWFAVHGEAIHGTRPWLVYGEGGVHTKGGHFKEDFNYTARDIRFTTKDGNLYAIALGWPADGKLLVKSLATPAGEISGVSLLGSEAEPDWTQTGDGLLVTLPAERISGFTTVLKITGNNLKPAPVPLEPVIVQADAKGAFKLDANDADLHGDGIRVKLRDVHTSIGDWGNPGDWAAWKVRFGKPGTYEIQLRVAAVHAGIEAAVEIAGQTFIARIPQTGGLESFQVCMVGKIEIRQEGLQTLKIRSADAATWNDINLSHVRLSPVN